MASMPIEAVRVEAVTHHYGRTTALADISFTLPKGEAIAMVGPDGVGKSTLLGLISGVKRIQGGQVTVLGHDLTSPDGRNAFLSRVAYMPQGLGHNLYPTLTVRENIDFFGRLFGLDAAQREVSIARLLAATGLAPFPDRPAGKLSGGMKQKLSLCCSLVHNPDLLILDEPTTGVDPLSRRQFWELVDTMRQDHPELTVIVSTAYMEEAERFKYLVAMDAGRIIAQGQTREIMARTGAHTLEEAYIRLLPEEKRPSEETLTVTPWQDKGGMPAIEAHDLVRRFGDFTAVDHVNFRIGKGEIFGFLGSNGCGKTTTMKVLTGLLDATSGTACLFGRQVTSGDMATRMRVGYMSQAFSLYEELSVRQNLMLHAQLYQMPHGKAVPLVAQALEQFALTPFADAMPGDLPLGIRQRLQLAAACLHNPEILILDEPTSGVDPAARDMFWRHLLRLSRDEGVTIFVSTHFMNEAERCDRISLMHRGRVLAVGSPAELTKARHAKSLEDAFISVLEENSDEPAPAATATATAPRPAPVERGPRWRMAEWFAYAWAFALRETTELRRDHIRLGFALLGPIVLLCIAAFSVSFDVQHIRMAVFDHDQSAASREFTRQFVGSRYFQELPPVSSEDAARAGLRSGVIELVIDIPPDFGRDLDAGRRPEIGFEIDGASPFTASNIHDYAEIIALTYNASLLRATLTSGAGSLPFSLAPRFAYNQEFRSIYAMTPGGLMLCTILIPAMLTALGIVREKEIGSIINLYASPASAGAFLIGKQAPYVVLAMISFATQVIIIVTLLGVPLKGSLLALTFGAFLFVLAATGLGLMMSTVVRSQVAAIFAVALICLIPSVNFSGLLYPVSTLTGASYWVGLGFPSSWFQIISLGTFTKGLGVLSFWRAYLMLAAFAIVYIGTARLMLRKQEA